MNQDVTVGAWGERHAGLDGTALLNLFQYFQLVSQSLGSLAAGAWKEGDITLITTDRLAGAIDSLKWRGTEFIDSADHGRQLQSASNFDAGSTFASETFNPTEAGSRFDGAGQKSTSRLIRLKAESNRLESRSRMAFWLRPGEKSSGHPAKNRQTLSNHYLEKKVVIGYRQFPNVIEYEVVFEIPSGENHLYAQFESLTGYMPAIFKDFYRLDLAMGKREPLSDGPGEQKHPVIFETGNHDFAMGIYSPQQPSPGYEAAGYGRFRFKNQNVVKWNSVFRIKSKQAIPAGRYRFLNFVVVGNLDQVTQTMLQHANSL